MYGELSSLALVGFIDAPLFLNLLLVKVELSRYVANPISRVHQKSATISRVCVHSGVNNAVVPLSGNNGQEKQKR